MVAAALGHGTFCVCKRFHMYNPVILILWGKKILLFPFCSWEVEAERRQHGGSPDLQLSQTLAPFSPMWFSQAKFHPSIPENCYLLHHTYLPFFLVSSYKQPAKGWGNWMRAMALRFNPHPPPQFHDCDAGCLVPCGCLNRHWDITSSLAFRYCIWKALFSKCYRRSIPSKMFPQRRVWRKTSKESLFYLRQFRVPGGLTFQDDFISGEHNNFWLRLLREFRWLLHCKTETERNVTGRNPLSSGSPGLKPSPCLNKAVTNTALQCLTCRKIPQGLCHSDSEHWRGTTSQLWVSTAPHHVQPPPPISFKLTVPLVICSSREAKGGEREREVPLEFVPLKQWEKMTRAWMWKRAWGRWAAYWLVFGTNKWIPNAQT